MIDNIEKTSRLLAALKQALPFEAGMTPELAKILRDEHGLAPDEVRYTVSKVSYAGDEGGILCHIEPADGQNAVIVSLTHLRMLRSTPLAAAVVDYQRHRVKKLKQQLRP